MESARALFKLFSVSSLIFIGLCVFGTDTDRA